MAKIKKTGKEEVDQFIAAQPPEIAQMVETIRNIIMGSGSEISEHIKWNNPCFFYNGELPDYDPKTYKREIAVFNLFKGRVMLVFPHGARVDDGSGFLEGDYKDGRRLLVFKDVQDIESKSKNLIQTIKAWLNSLEK